MLFAIVALFKEDVDPSPADAADDVNAFLGQPIHPPRLAGSLKGPDGRKAGELMLIEAANFDAAEKVLHRSPYLKRDLYDRFKVLEYAIEAGRLNPS